VNEQEAALVRHIFTRFVHIGSTMQLAEELNAAGYLTKTWTTRTGKVHAGTLWHKGHLYRILNNPIYIGDVTHKGVRYPGEHAAIISQRLWDQAHAILERNYRVRGARTRARTDALLRGILRCAHCGGAMGPSFTKRRGKVYRYYQCVSAAKRSDASCPTRHLPAGEIERTVIDQLRGVLRAPEFVAQTYREARAQTLEGGDTGEPFSEQEVSSALHSLDPIWEHLCPGEQARIVQLLVKQVDVYPNHADVRIRAEGLTSLVAELRAQEEETLEAVGARA
jgi:site-specific DNA recombinase